MQDRPRNTSKIYRNQYEKAFHLYKTGDLEKARAEFAKCGDAQGVKIQALIAMCHYGEDHALEALAILEPLAKKVTTAEDKQTAYNHLIKIYSYLCKKNTNPDHFESYLKKFKNALDRYPYPNDETHQFYTIRYLSLPEIGEYELSLKMLDRLLHSNKKNRKDLLDSLQLMKTTITEKYTKTVCSEDDAKAILQEASKATTSNINALHKIAMSHPHLIDIQKTKIIPTNTAQDYKIASMYEALGMTNEAEEAYTNTVKKYPSSWMALFNYAYFLTQQGDHSRSNEILLNTLSIHPKPSREQLIKTYISLAINSRELCDEKKTTLYVNQALQLKPQNATDKANLDSLQGKLIDDSPVVSNSRKKSTQIYEQARKTDNRRFNENHPLSKLPGSKISTNEHTTRYISTHTLISKAVASDSTLKKPTNVEAGRGSKKAMPHKYSVTSSDIKIEFVRTLQPETKVERKLNVPHPARKKIIPTIAPQLKPAENPSPQTVGRNNPSWFGLFSIQSTLLLGTALATTALIFNICK